ncbi:MAG: NAD(P)-binding protein [Woeseiaceae bacterium]
MNKQDRRLGMDRDISRRDFVGGVAMAVGAALLPGCARNAEPVAELAEAYYPPAATGMRGAHPGSFEAAHAAVQGRTWIGEQTGEFYDLVVVGAGISGLSAAYMYRRDVDPNARILIVDNHDDFGGHAKRNEFSLDGKTYIGYGGTMFMDAPATYPAAARRVVDEIGIKVDKKNETDYDAFYAAYDAQNAVFFDEPTFGRNYIAGGGYFSEESLRDAPISDEVAAELVNLFADDDELLADYSPAERREAIAGLSWREYLSRVGGYSEATLNVLQKWSHGLWGIGIDALPAHVAYVSGYPGFKGFDESQQESDNVGVHRFSFPDGNASVARLLVRKIVPGAASGNSMEDSITARFDYDALDQGDNLTRIRLSSTVVNIQHQNGDLDADVDLTYVQNGDARLVTANKVIWAGYHALLPYICPDVPDQQKEALSSSVRAPLVYTNVLLRDWNSVAKLKLRRTYCPGSFFQSVRPTHPVDMGDYKIARSPDEPLVLALQHIPAVAGMPAAEQFRAGRQALLETSFETFERNIREQLNQMLAPAGFDAARDIVAITVNRWPHGYALSVDKNSDEIAWLPSEWPQENSPWVAARQRLGNIAFAGTDASSNAMTESAIEEAHRAVQDLS